MLLVKFLKISVIFLRLFLIQYLIEPNGFIVYPEFHLWKSDFLISATRDLRFKKIGFCWFFFIFFTFERIFVYLVLFFFVEYEQFILSFNWALVSHLIYMGRLIMAYWSAGCGSRDKELDLSPFESLLLHHLKHFTIS